jgi:hypothetical protein
MVMVLHVTVIQSTIHPMAMAFRGTLTPKTIQSTIEWFLSTPFQLDKNHCNG